MPHPPSSLPPTPLAPSAQTKVVEPKRKQQLVKAEVERRRYCDIVRVTKHKEARAEGRRLPLVRRRSLILGMGLPNDSAADLFGPPPSPRAKGASAPGSPRQRTNHKRLEAQRRRTLYVRFMKKQVRDWGGGGDGGGGGGGCWHGRRGRRCGRRG